MGRADDEVGRLGLAPNLSLVRFLLYSKVTLTSSIVIRQIHFPPKQTKSQPHNLKLIAQAKFFHGPRTVIGPHSLRFQRVIGGQALWDLEPARHRGRGYTLHGGVVVQVAAG